MLDKIKIITIENLSIFLSNVKLWVETKLSALDTKIDRQIFQGTQSELEKAIEAGLVDENTLIILTDTPDSPIYEFCEYEDILAMFPEYS